MTVKKSVPVALAQINNSFSGQNYLPYSTGLLQVYVEKHASNPARFRFLDPVYKRLPIAECVRRMEEGRVAAFSVYVWNYRISLEVARRLKAADPTRLIVFGGPHVPDRAEDFLREHPFIDIAVHGEGEQVFLDILEAYPGRDWDDIPGVSYLDDQGRFVTHAKKSRLRDISVIPSPYISGTFDRLMAANPDERWIVLWETNRGCPFACTYCDWGSSTQSKIFTFELDRLRQEIDWFSRNQIEFVFCADANFGILPRDIDIVRMVAANKQEFGYPMALSVQNTKNATERAYQAQKILNDAGLNKGVTIALQSVDDRTLEYVKRDNISIDSFEELQRRFTKDGIATYSDLILGLPGETYESFANGCAHVIANGQHNRIQFSNLSILPNAEMANPEYLARHGMVTVESQIINVHGMREEMEDDLIETQLLVVGTASMPKEDWARARAFSWMAAFLHFDKVLQIPLLIAHYKTGISFRSLIEAFMEIDPDRYPLIGSLRDLFLNHALVIQNGGPEYIYSADWLGIYWPADEYAYIKISVEGKLDEFYGEAGAILADMLGDALPREMLDEALRLNRALLKQPGNEGDVTIHLNFELAEFYRSSLIGQDIDLPAGAVSYRIRRTPSWDSWEAWMQAVVWYCNKNGAYLYGTEPLGDARAGHY